MRGDARTVRRRGAGGGGGSGGFVWKSVVQGEDGGGMRIRRRGGIG